jgi:autotransporter-associated beta strand protein
MPQPPANPISSYALQVASLLDQPSSDTAYLYPIIGVTLYPLLDLTAATPSGYTDCSGWANYVLASLDPIHEAVAAQERFIPYFNPGTIAAYDSATGQPTTLVEYENQQPWARADVLQYVYAGLADNHTGSDGFDTITNWASLQPGDVFAYSTGIYTDLGAGPSAGTDPTLALTGDTGHTGIVVGAPTIVAASSISSPSLSPDAVTVVELPVVDSSNVKHYDDGRNYVVPSDPANLPADVDPSLLQPGGTGTGTLYFALDAAGNTIQLNFDASDPWFPNDLDPTNGSEAAVSFAAARLTSTIDLSQYGTLPVDVYPNALPTLDGIDYAQTETLVGTGGLLVEGGGTLTLSGPNSYTGNTTVTGDATTLSIAHDDNLGADTASLEIGAGTTLTVTATMNLAHPLIIDRDATIEIAAGDTVTAAGTITVGPDATLLLTPQFDATGAITFDGIGATLAIDQGVTPTATIGGLQQGDFIDVGSISGGTVTVSGNQLTLIGTGGSLSLSLDTSYGGQFRASSDGSGGTLISYVTASQPYVIPIYHQTIASSGAQSLIIYASVGGGPLDPYLLDSGSPNMFSTYGSWWPGHSTEITQPGTGSFTFAAGVSYNYDTVATNVSLGTGAGGTVVAAANNVNVALITNTGTSSPQTDFANWASAVAAGNPPFGSDQSYGNFSAGLYGSNSLATVLAQLPISDNLENGFIIQSGGIAASAGTLTVGLDPSLIQQWQSDPATITLEMTSTGTTLPNPDGNTVSVSGDEKAQVGTTSITLSGTQGSDTFTIPLVIDTGGGLNDVIYANGALLTHWVQGGGTDGPLQNGTTFDLSGMTLNQGVATILDYITGSTGLPTGGVTTVVNTTTIADQRVNPGISLFYDYNVMFDIQGGKVLLQPIACFAAGTRIATERGPVAVERLREGDRLPTAIGGTLQPISWIGRRRVDCRRHPAPETVWPVRIAARAFDGNTPTRDLFLSPDHAVYLDGVLVPIKYLINHTTIVQVPRSAVTYYHVELPRHEVIWAEGMPAETYLDVGDRSNFDSRGGVCRLHPSFVERQREAMGCAELVVTGPAVQALQARLAELAASEPAAIPGHRRNVA